MFQSFFFSRITLPTKIQPSSFSLIDNILSNTIDKTDKPMSGLLINDLSDHKIIFTFNPIRSGLFQTANDPGGGGLNPPPPPYDLENYFVNLHHIIHVHFTRCSKVFSKICDLTIL